MVSLIATNGATVGLAALAVIAACGLWAARLTAFAASWKPWYLAFAIFTTISTLLSLVAQSLNLAINNGGLRSGYGYIHYLDIQNASTFTTLTFSLFGKTSQALLFCTIMITGAGVATYYFQRWSRVVGYLGFALLLAINCVILPLECSYYAYFTHLGRHDTLGATRSLKQQSHTATKLQFAFSSLLVFLAVVAIGQSFISMIAAKPKRKSCNLLLATSVLLLLSAATDLGILNKSVDPYTNKTRFMTVGTWVAIRVLGVMFVVWPLVASTVTLSMASKANNDVEGSGKERYSQDSAEEPRIGSAATH